MKTTDKIKEAKLIQDMIVNQGDADEISKLVLRVITGADIVHIMVDYDNSLYCTDADNTEVNLGECYYSHETQYTTSLNACQSLMLEGWWFDLIQCGDGVFKAGVYKPKYDPQYYHRGESAPEAWLYAILESYIYEWSNEDD